jgi:CheY-like chemotaxis protein
MDLIMPEMGGIETYHELRKTAPAIPIIICSGYDQDEISSTINDDEHAGFMQKPYKPDQLRNMLTKFLNTTG